MEEEILTEETKALTVSENGEVKEETKEETKEEVRQEVKDEAPRGSAAKKILNAALSVLFCGVSLLYMAVTALDGAGKIASGADRLLISEVYGAADTAPETEDTDATDKPKVSPETEAPPDVPPDTAPAAEDGELPVERESLANYDLMTDLFNETSYTPDLAAAASGKDGVGLSEALYKKYGADAPIVLIVHTHGTEAYSNGSSYSADESFRTEDTSKNVVAVGDVMEKVLRSEGVNVIHCREMFDRESYSESYAKSYAAVASYLKEYPSIAYVIDVHRDSVFRENGACVATAATVGDKPSAQAMIVVGTDEGGANHPGWQKNLSLAMNIQSAMASLEESVPRKVNLRIAAFNQGLCPGSLLFEIGSCGNTLAEAKRAAVVAALGIASAVTGDEPSFGAAEAAELFAP